MATRSSQKTCLVCDSFCEPLPVGLVYWSVSVTSVVRDMDKKAVEEKLRLHVDRLAGLIGPRRLEHPKTIQATVGYARMAEVALGVAGAMRKLLR